MQALMNTNEAAEYLGFSVITLKVARKTGLLSGVTAPDFIRIGPKTIRYKREALDNWISKQEKAGA